MENINIDDGRKRFSINGDESRCIAFNTNDVNILVRLQEVQENLPKVLQEIGDVELESDGTTDNKEFIELISSVNKKIREQFDYIFDSQVSDTVFGSANPLSTKNGITFAERFIVAITPILQKDIGAEQQKSEARMAKHTVKYFKK